MDFFQYDTNPWGQDILVRISWDLLWAALIFGVLFVVGHLVMRKLWFPAHGATAEKAAAQANVVVDDPGTPVGEAGGADDAAAGRVKRHSLGSRLFHWTMAAAMFVLLITAFFPLLGIQFPWLTIHWVAGLILIASIVFHVVHATFFMDLWAVWIGSGDVRDMWRRFSRSIGRKASAPALPGKYPLENKLYHHAVAVTGLGVSITGVLMMFRIDTPLFARDPYMFAEQTWGWVYVVHGLSAVGLVGLIMTHVYFAMLPEKRWLTWSMINGWISREKYVKHHDPQRWASRD
jgi:cytochrome b subunit of formate dehydrogenase